MAIVGQQLIAPESGWRRYDDTDSRIMYKGTGWSTYNNTNYYKGNGHLSNIVNDNIIIKFYGTKFRIIDSRYNDRSNNIQILIDGISVGMISEYGNSANSIDIIQILQWEIINLPLGIHTIKIINKTTNFFGLDAIDIDSTGYLVHPLLNQISTINKMSIGDCIPCRYTALSSKSSGYFSELGTCIADEIPVAGTPTPDGLFYLIYIGKNYLGKKMFLCDRNIQINISWDTINNSGFIYSNLVNELSGNSKKILLRLITGGVSSTDTDNEWDRIIVNSTFGGKITAGDDNIWHWNNSNRSWTSSTYSSNGNTYRTVRGVGTSINTAGVKAISGAVTSETLNKGFRPILILDVFEQFLIKNNSNYFSIDIENYDTNLNKFKALSISDNIPNKTELINNGFVDINNLISISPLGLEQSKPIDKINSKFKIVKYQY